MNPASADPLAQLRDVHLPPDPGWWPPAIGWWLAALLGLILLVSVVVFIRRLTRPTVYRTARNDLEQIASIPDRAGFESALAAWIRRCVIARDGPQTAGLTGSAWLQRVKQAAPNTDIQPVWEQLFVARYRRSDDQLLARDTMLATCRQWCREALR